jgi:hypothetical protein
MIKDLSLNLDSIRPNSSYRLYYDFMHYIRNIVFIVNASTFSKTVKELSYCLKKIN